MVYLVGAGPGGAEWITWRGLRLLRSCDALVYDRLGTEELLEQVRPDCRKIYVGKEPGRHSCGQEQIHRILIEAAQTCDIVVRLKGGDPFVFGRGGEEAVALRNAGIPFQIVPGISSAIAVPELAGIPVTQRAVSRSFHVFTGHTEAGGQTSFSHIHREEGTSVFLMGLTNLPLLVERLREQGQPINTPVAVIASGTLPDEQIVIGTMADIVQRVAEENVQPPAVIVVGETVRFREQIGSAVNGFGSCGRSSLKTPSATPLEGRHIGLIGTSVLQKRLRERLESAGASLEPIYHMQVEPVQDNASFASCVHALERYTWIVFTSSNGVTLFFSQVRRAGVDYRAFAATRFAVVGEGTRRALRDQGFTADYMPAEFTTQALAHGLAPKLSERDAVLLPRAAHGRPELSAALRATRAVVQEITLYSVNGVRARFWGRERRMDAVVFASPSGVDAYLRERGVMTARRELAEPLLVAIGPVTAKALCAQGLSADLIPDNCDTEHIVEALRKRWEEKSDGEIAAAAPE